MTTDITELAQSLKAAAEKATPGPWALARDRKTVVSNQSHPIANLSDAMHRMLADGTTGQDAEFISLANPANILALVEAQEKAQAKNALVAGGIEAAAKLHERIAELESRTVTVKLPERYACEMGYNAPDPNGDMLDRDAVIDALTAAGIKWEAE